MKQFAHLAVTALLIAVPASAQHNPNHTPGLDGTGHTSHGQGNGYGHLGGGPEDVVAVPELDPAAAGTALALLAGGALLLADRRRRRRSAV